MIEVNQRLLMVILSLAIVCVLSIVGSFTVWMQSGLDGKGSHDPESQIHRWKWMVIAFFIIVAFMLMGAK